MQSQSTRKFPKPATGLKPSQARLRQFWRGGKACHRDQGWNLFTPKASRVQQVIKVLLAMTSPRDGQASRCHVSRQARMPMLFEQPRQLLDVASKHLLHALHGRMLLLRSDLHGPAPLHVQRDLVRPGVDDGHGDPTQAVEPLARPSAPLVGAEDLVLPKRVYWYQGRAVLYGKAAEAKGRREDEQLPAVVGQHLLRNTSRLESVGVAALEHPLGRGLGDGAAVPEHQSLAQQGEAEEQVGDADEPAPGPRGARQRGPCGHPVREEGGTERERSVWVPGNQVLLVRIQSAQGIILPLLLGVGLKLHTGGPRCHVHGLRQCN
mmetsp:Transcript_19156/g.39885  ORF Transcript_19156/g.39885 Transcript_19156/m.39885 type:complete len:321 (+) Transcript_19156:185-1147(+)